MQRAEVTPDTNSTTHFGHMATLDAPRIKGNFESPFDLVKRRAGAGERGARDHGRPRRRRHPQTRPAGAFRVSQGRGAGEPGGFESGGRGVSETGADGL